jgi:hypothetical protein
MYACIRILANNASWCVESTHVHTKLHMYNIHTNIKTHKKKYYVCMYVHKLSLCINVSMNMNSCVCVHIYVYVYTYVKNITVPASGNATSSPLMSRNVSRTSLCSNAILHMYNRTCMHQRLHKTKFTCFWKCNIQSSHVSKRVVVRDGILLDLF